MINICNYLKSLLFSMCYVQILVDPRYKMIFKNTLDKLVEEIRCEQLMDVSTREIVCERLRGLCKECIVTKLLKRTYHDITSDPKFIPEDSWIKLANEKICLLV